MTHYNITIKGEIVLALMKSLETQGVKKPYGFSVTDIATDVMEVLKPNGDGIALFNTTHPDSSTTEPPEDINLDSLETVEIELPDGWMDISTAPRDGTVILLAGGTTTEEDYKKEMGVLKERPVTAFWDACEDDDEIDGWWAICYWDGRWRDGYEEPKYWMPIKGVPQ